MRVFELVDARFQERMSWRLPVRAKEIRMSTQQWWSSKVGRMVSNCVGYGYGYGYGYVSCDWVAALLKESMDVVCDVDIL